MFQGLFTLHIRSNSPGGNLGGGGGGGDLGGAGGLNQFKARSISVELIILVCIKLTYYGCRSDLRADRSANLVVCRA